MPLYLIVISEKIPNGQSKDHAIYYDDIYRRDADFKEIIKDTYIKLSKDESINKTHFFSRQKYFKESCDGLKDCEMYNTIREYSNITLEAMNSHISSLETRFNMQLNKLSNHII